MRDCHVQATGILQEETSASTRCCRDSRGALVVIWITLAENFHCSFAPYDENQLPSGIVENVVGITNGGQRVYGSPGSCI
jgi:hypothetical protein